MQVLQADPILEDSKHAKGSTDSIGSDGGARARLQRAVDPGNVPLWTNCYPNDDVKRYVDVGFAVSYAVMQKYSTDAERMAYLQNIVSLSNYYIYGMSCHTIPYHTIPWHGVSCQGHVIHGTAPEPVTAAWNRFQAMPSTMVWYGMVWRTPRDKVITKC